MGLHSFVLHSLAPDSFVNVEGILLQTQMGTDALRLYGLARMQKHGPDSSLISVGTSNDHP
jgi:hypothetical protein